jgi:hypothetical protein
MISEFDMGEGQVLKKISDSVVSLSFCVVTNDIHCFGRMPVSPGIAERRRGHAS